MRENIKIVVEGIKKKVRENIKIRRREFKNEERK